jgi:ABC-2 type transport system permease protein
VSEQALPRLRPSWAAMAWRQYRLERRMFWRNPSAAFFNFALPLLFLAAFWAIFADRPDLLEVIVPGIAGMAVMSSTFAALAHNIVSLRERGILKRVRGTPLPASAYLAAIGASAVTNTALQVALIVIAGNLVFGVAWPQDPGSFAGFIVIGVVCFAALGVALAHAIPNIESAPAYVNAIFLPAIMISGVFFEQEDAPALLRDVAEVLPLTHCIQGLSAAMIDGESIAANAGALGVLALWAAVGIVLAVRGFSWESRRS